jgi:hypothetical protein
MATAHGLKKIGTGLLIAATGAVAVMCYIVGLSNLYFGRFRAGCVQLLAMAMLGFLFLRHFSPFVMSLAGPEEHGEITPEQKKSPLDLFGLREVLAFCLVTAAVVLLADSVFFSVGNGRWLALCAALAVGGWGWKLWR